MLTLDSVYRAAYCLKEVARKTDLIFSDKLPSDGELYLKTENLQVTGSFKLRGAYYKISRLSEEEKARGIIACSAGNHAQGVALAASRMGVRSIICMPDGAPISKVEATKALGAEVVLVPGAYDDAYEKACQLKEELGATFIHPFDDEDVIAGQATIGLEVLEQLPEAEVILVPIGGGGLAAGIASVMKNLRPDVKIYGVQAQNASAFAESFHAKKILSHETVATFADGIAVKNPGNITFELISKYVDDIVTVSEDEIAAAILALIEKQKLITEGAGAVPVAAAMFGKVDIKDKKTVCILSGGNIDVNILSRVITRGLVTSGRMSNLTIALEDKPGQLTGVSEIISRCGGNVISVLHERSDANMAITSCYLKIGLETRDAEQIREIRDELNKAGFQIV